MTCVSGSDGDGATLTGIPIQLKQCHLQLLALCRNIVENETRVVRTISSLHIGHASCEPDTAGAADMEVSALSREIREARSCASGENCEVEACELRDRLLVEGDSRPLGCGDEVEVAGEGERFFPLPRTRPPPSTLRAMVCLVEHEPILLVNARKYREEGAWVVVDSAKHPSVSE